MAPCRADQKIDLACARGFEHCGLVVGLWLGVVVVCLRPIFGLQAKLDLEPAVEERHDCHHSCVDGLRRKAFVLQFVLVLQNILAAVFVSKLFSDESDEIVEVLALGLHSPSSPASALQVSELGVNLVFDDLRTAEFNDARSFGDRDIQILARNSRVFNVIESQLTPALRLQRVHTCVDPVTVEVQEISSLGVFLLDAPDDYKIRFDLAVRMKRGFATPAFVCPNVFVDAELCHEIPL